MKYRHRYHAGNFADVHKHVTLLALLAALQKKDKGFLYLDTHAGRGAYDLSSPAAEARAGIGRFQETPVAAEELRSRSCASPSSSATSTVARRSWPCRRCARRTARC
jgi:23S rRNA (adenine2030-N6)-methyltransferase